MKWVERLRVAAGWDLFLQLLAILLLVIAGIWVLASRSCEGGGDDGTTVRNAVFVDDSAESVNFLRSPGQSGRAFRGALERLRDP